jgi:hypothetical protein
VRELAADGHKVETTEEVLKIFQKLEETMTKHRNLVCDELKTNSEE